MFTHEPLPNDSNFINRLLTRHPWGCSILLILFGGLVLVGVLYGPNLDTVPKANLLKANLLVASFIFIIFGVLILLMCLGQVLVRLLRKIIYRPDPDLAILLSSPPSRPGYEEGKAEMELRLVEQLGITSQEARERVRWLERSGKIIFMPNGTWIAT